jgi:anthranilate/para-aminobenzoate synthase component I
MNSRRRSAGRNTNEKGFVVQGALLGTIRRGRAKLGAMPLCAVVVDVPADALAIAARLKQRSGFAFLHDASGRGGRSFVASDPVETTSALPLPRGAGSAPLADTRACVPRWIGAIPYESARGLERARWTRTPDERPLPQMSTPCWQRYAEVVEVDQDRGVVRVIGEEPRRVDRLAAHLGQALATTSGPTRLVPLGPDEAPSSHVARVRRAQELIQAGDLYQVNLARRLRFALQGDPFELYR